MSSDSLHPPEASGPVTSGDYQVVARRYRPQRFEDLVGQQQVAQALRNAISTSRVGHAYLFTGARGVGKTSTARILAKALNCVAGPTITPCNQCDICLSVSAGEDVDVLEIDGASNRGIDEIRQLRANVNVRPSRSRFKIYIIDEVHMLTREAFNALLKTLEEPPAHVKFIFCTTDAEKIPITVLSRCQRFDFPGIRSESIVSRLGQIVAAEGVEAEPAALELLGRRAAGSMRDSQSLLEQLLAFGGRTITVADVHQLLGTADAVALGQLAQRLLDRDAAGGLALLDQTLAQGVDVAQLVQQLVGYFRDMLAAAVGCPAEMLLYAAPGDYPLLVEAGRQFGVETILAAVQILDHTLVRMRQSALGRTLAEAALVRIARLEDLEQLNDLISQIGLEGEAPPAARPPLPRAASPTIPEPSASAEQKKNEASADAPETSLASASTSAAARTSSTTEAEATSAPAATTSPPPDTELTELPPDSIRGVWEEILTEIGGMTADMGMQCERLAISAPNRLVIYFPAAYNSCKSYCERPEKKAQLERALAQKLGKHVNLDFEALPGELAPPARESVVPTAPSRQLRRDIESHPLVVQAVEIFGARVMGVEEPRPEELQSAAVEPGTEGDDS